LKKPFKILFLILITLWVFIPSNAYSQQSHERIYDGPYFFFDNNKLTAIWVRSGYVKERELTSENFNVLKKRYDLSFSYNDILERYHEVEPDSHVFTVDGSIAIISDLHGEYDNYIRLLKKSGIIDKNLNWSFGKNHLIILGDIFDRGPMVTEILWHLFGLEMQASAAGGKLHIILGNHEYMILTGNSQFINGKYLYVEQIMGKSYSSLFLANSVLGDWLRKKPVILKINNLLFTHAGISTDFVKGKTDMDQLNRFFKDMLTGSQADKSVFADTTIINSKVSEMLSYRNYFSDKQFNESKLDSILTFYGVERVIVGHTTLPEVKSMFNNKLIGSDAGMMNYHSGELLLYQNGSFYRVLYNGKQIQLF
jgi:hypothetical protein